MSTNQLEKITRRPVNSKEIFSKHFPHGDIVLVLNPLALEHKKRPYIRWIADFTCDENRNERVENLQAEPILSTYKNEKKKYFF